VYIFEILSSIDYKIFYVFLLSLRMFIIFLISFSLTTSCIFHWYIRRQRKMQS